MIVGILGQARSGKDTFARALGIPTFSFAGPLKSLLCAMDPSLVGLRRPFPGADTLRLTAELRDGVERISPDFWAYHGGRLALEGVMNATDPVVCSTGPRLSTLLSRHGEDRVKARYPEYRRLLQHLGTGMRALDDSFWLSAGMAQAAAVPACAFTDVRFPNEADAIEAAGGVLVRMIRAGQEPPGPDAHISETALLDRRTDHTFTCASPAEVADAARWLSTSLAHVLRAA